MKSVKRRDAVIDGEDAGAALLVPPLIATPDLLLDSIVVPLDILLEDERLTQIEQLSLATSCLRVFRHELIHVGHYVFKQVL